MNKNRGFTVIELQIVLAMLLIVLLAGVGLFVLLAGNQYYTGAGVLREIRIDHPDTVSILKTERHVFSPSLILVEKKDGSRTFFELRTNILFNYKLKRLNSPAAK